MHARNQKTMLAALLLTAIARPATAQISNNMNVLGPMFAHNEQGQTAPSTTATLPASALTLTDRKPALPTLFGGALLGQPPATLVLPPTRVDVLQTAPPRLDEAPPTGSGSVPSTVPTPGSTIILVLAASFAGRRPRR